jgi:hypothetical protein
MKQAYPNETWDELITPIVISRPIINPNITWADVKANPDKNWNY